MSKKVLLCKSTNNIYKNNVIRDMYIKTYKISYTKWYNLSNKVFIFTWQKYKIRYNKYEQKFAIISGE